METGLEDKIYKTIKEYQLIEPEDVVIVAVSGGPDSMCLLNSLYNLKEKLQIKKIAVAHVNHMLREEAELETQYVKKFCEEKNIDFYAKYVNIKEISEHNKTGEEETGRIERYKFFEEIAEKINANKIAIAHNHNDNAETVLMHLLRGSAISGLVGIKPYKENKYIRPILKCDRTDIEKYCEDKGLNPKYDKTNDDNTYTRNKIRNELIPYIKKEFNPNIIETLNRLAESALVEEEYLEKITENTYKNLCVLEDKENNIIVLDLKKFNSLDEAIKPRIILYTFNILNGNVNGIERIHLNDIIKLCKKNIGNKYLSPNKNIKVYIKSGQITIKKVLK